ncbi:shikimate kinase [Flavobacterium sp. UBA6135]|uniref:shikimate kinase n=1 Tax=Flavobacterium sp. UBA6135 TaxID=1946553 RepID=UPI0025BEFEE3|nr:shikimate kinase [Flavobacterium sp. UBA6135]
MKIVLVGYMGSGKSAVSEKLAKKLNLKALDLDFIIEKNENQSISDLFLNKGELYFRKKEHEFLKKMLSKETNFVLSLGGGTPCYAGNHLFLEQPDVVSIYLKTSIETLTNRLECAKSQRPLLANLDNDELKEFIGKHLFERSYYYNFAKYIISTDAKSVETIVDEIADLLF